MASRDAPYSHLDPASAEQVDAIRTALVEHWSAPGMEAFCRRVMTDSPDEILREEAKVALGRYAYQRYDYREAERLCREALSALWGTGARGELAACINLAMVCLLGRQYFEALVLARRGVELATASGIPLAIAKGNLHLAGVLRAVGDIPRAQAALSEAERMLDQLEPTDRDNHAANLAAERVRLALLDGDAEAALKYSEESKQHAGDDNWGLLDDVLRTAVLVAAGRHAEAYERLKRLAHAGGNNPFRATRGRLEAECLAVLQTSDAALWSARSLLDWLEGAGHDEIGSGTRLDEAERLGHLLIDVCQSPGDARRAYEVAATAALERIRELQAFALDLPHLSRASDEDRQILEEYRGRFESERALLLNALARLLEQEGPATRLFGPSREDQDAAIKVCAWCQKVQGPDGIWFMPEQALLPEGPLYVTHGICEACFRRETGDEPAA
ncbi:MAG: hypothetical protein QNJ98_19245 [Planctomycetota bacterium]|nr:hypothetical protein [Planctomycetota bacterium]